MALSMPKKTFTVYKCTRSDGTDFHTGTVDYAEALRTGKPIEVSDPDPASVGACGRGIHACDEPKKTLQYVDRTHRPYRWFRLLVRPVDEIARDATKIRFRRIGRVEAELSLADIFGSDIGERVQRAKAEIATWREIPWLKPVKMAGKAQLEKLFVAWHEAITPWLASGKAIPKKCKIVRTVHAAAADAADAADAAHAGADAAADAADAADAAADAAAADADAAADAADAAASRRAARITWWLRWHVRPVWVLRRQARWIIGGMDKASPWEPIIAMYRLGCLPIGYVKGEFVIYAPEPKS